MENDSRDPGIGRTGSDSGAEGGTGVDGTAATTGADGTAGTTGAEGVQRSTEARAALNALDADAAQLSQRLVTPWWYHLALGTLVALAIGALSLPGSSSTIPVALVVVAIPLLVQAYNRRYGIATSQPAGPRSRRMLLIILAVLVLLLGSTVLIKLGAADPAWTVLPAVLGFVATVLLGRRYDTVLRAEVASPGTRR